ncbi:MAG: M18 family aminopeptidase [Erysipelotrichaceae bacterium]
MSNQSAFIDFLNQSHCAFMAIDTVCHRLDEAGFIRLRENSTWNLQNNRYYYVVRNQSSLIAFKIPEMNNVKSVNIVASHSDSPSLKVKPVEDITSDKYGRINVEVYGGAILSSWFDKPLSLTGRVVLNQNGQVVSQLVDLDEDVAIIPNVAIHQNRQINEGYKYNPQVDLVPIMALQEEQPFFKEFLAKRLHVDKQDILAHDLFFYNRQKARIWGEKQQFISSGRIDNLESVFTSLVAFINSYSSQSINVLAVFDNEEVGAVTKQGMASRFLLDVIERIFASFYYVDSDIKAILANSFLMSCDNAHAVHPNHPELYDSFNKVYMNEGVVIKTSASQSYVSDAVSVAICKQLCQRAKVPYQIFANKSDSRGGSTQAAISTINLPVNMADIGLAQLAMHSSYETCGSSDVDYMINLLSQLYNSTIVMDDNRFIING